MYSPAPSTHRQDYLSLWQSSAQIMHPMLCIQWRAQRALSSPRSITLRISVCGVSSSFSSYAQYNPDIDYRWFDVNNIQPRFEFGYGLSYTTFNYSSLSIQTLIKSASLPSGSTTQPGGQSGLYSPAITANFTIANTGNYDGNEVAQLYLVRSIFLNHHHY